MENMREYIVAKVEPALATHSPIQIRRATSKPTPATPQISSPVVIDDGSLESSVAAGACAYFDKA